MGLRLLPRGRGALEVGVAACVLTGAAVLMPIGLARVADAELVAAGVTLGAGADPSASSPRLAVLLVALLTWLPLGDLATRANLAAVAVAPLLALAVLRVARLVLVALAPRGAALAEGDGPPPGPPPARPRRRAIEITPAFGMLPARAAALPGVLRAMGPAAPPIAAHLRGPAPVMPARTAPSEQTGARGGGRSGTAPRGTARGPRGASAAAEPSGRSGPRGGAAAEPGGRRSPGASGSGRGGPLRGAAAEPGARWTSDAAGSGRGGRRGSSALAAGTPASERQVRTGDTRPFWPPAAGSAPEPVVTLAPTAAHDAIAIAGGTVAGLFGLGGALALAGAPAAVLGATLVLAAVAGARLGGRAVPVARRALTVMLLAGLSLGAGPVALVAVPLVLVLFARGWQRGDAWPRLAPFAFAAGAAVVLPGGAAELRGGFATWRAGLGDATRVVETAGFLVGELGVIAALVAAVGIAVLLAQRPAWLALGAVMATVALGLAAAAGPPARFHPATACTLILLALAGIALTVGIAHLAARLGPARAAAALTLAVIAATWPLLDGGIGRWQSHAGTPEALLTATEARLAPGVHPVPGSAELAALLRYGQALGRRPDLGVAVESEPR